MYEGDIQYNGIDGRLWKENEELLKADGIYVRDELVWMLIMWNDHTILLN